MVRLRLLSKTGSDIHIANRCARRAGLGRQLFNNRSNNGAESWTLRKVETITKNFTRRRVDQGLLIEEVDECW
jgi:hypothetical protein